MDRGQALNNSQLNNSLLNTSKKVLYCNHCLLDCDTPETMREHYKSEFHKYNLSRVTSNLNPLTHQDFLLKKAQIAKMSKENVKENKTQVKTTTSTSSNDANFSCDACKKTFLTSNKYQEHNASKAHHQQVEKQEAFKKNKSEELQKDPKDEKNTLDDETICLFCNQKSDSLVNNLLHMNSTHNFDLPFRDCIRDFKGYINVLAKKIIKYNACITCDVQNFVSFKALQNHMLDKAHVYVNDEDLEEHLFKFYSLRKILEVKGYQRRTNTYKVIKIKLSISNDKKNKSSKTKEKKPIKEEDEEGWETEEENDEAKEEVTLDTNDKSNKSKPTTTKTNKTLSAKATTDEDAGEDESDDDSFEPIELNNGELMLQDGSVLGNKLYSVYYKQRVRISKYQNLAAGRKREIKIKSANREKTYTKDHKKGFKSNDLKMANSFKARCQITC